MFFALLVAQANSKEEDVVQNLIKVWAEINSEQKSAFEEILRILFERGSNKNQTS